VAQVAAACQANGVDALLLYSSFTRPAQVCALTQFVPFWSQAMLVVTAQGRTMLTMATTGRTVQWINSTSCVDEVVVGPEIGATASKWLASQTQASAIAVANMSDVPQAALDSLRHSLTNVELREANAWYAPLEAGFTPAPMVAQRALQIARAGLSLVTSLTFQGTHDIVAAIDGHCRSSGAEEVAVLLAPDLSSSSLLHRLEGETSLGECFAVQVSLAYKGCWLRIGSSYRRDAATVTELPECGLARTEVQRGHLGASSGDLAASAASAAKANLEDWSLEARFGGLPLATIACAGHTAAESIPAFSTLYLQLHAGNVSFVLAEPVAFS
jgi:hypothetical protein